MNRNALVDAHWYLCRRGARKFYRGSVDRCDLEQVAAIGLIKACDRYDPSVATPFEAHFDRDQVDLQMTVPHLEFEYLARLHTKLIAQRLGNDDASGAVNGQYPSAGSIPSDALQDSASQAEWPHG